MFQASVHAKELALFSLSKVFKEQCPTLNFQLLNNNRWLQAQRALNFLYFTHLPGKCPWAKALAAWEKQQIYGEKFVESAHILIIQSLFGQKYARCGKRYALLLKHKNGWAYEKRIT